ncbi:uncharacterized protein F4817DRAFT_311849 [Daldinia loculata]|uniref:uncharacterized protein n=1 Tax=Daldinia loculata TaxID=103429 RepID=UPI0020C3DEFB|nr:uncharacterized protein F4817DRAFT_311849 [Daldinia loculata]KAI1651591.1 hypothetical protein F4817DRAFT_311849 [Daldinia loculata]
MDKTTIVSSLASIAIFIHIIFNFILSATSPASLFQGLPSSQSQTSTPPPTPRESTTHPIPPPHPSLE